MWGGQLKNNNYWTPKRKENMGKSGPKKKTSVEKENRTHARMNIM